MLVSFLQIYNDDLFLLRLTLAGTPEYVNRNTWLSCGVQHTQRGIRLVMEQINTKLVMETEHKWEWRVCRLPCMLLVSKIKLVISNSLLRAVVAISSRVSVWVLLSANSAILQLYHGENKLIFNEMTMRSTLY